jgi:hypothetical protein
VNRARSRGRALAVSGVVTATALLAALGRPTAAVAETGRMAVRLDGNTVTLNWRKTPGAGTYLVIDERARRVVRSGSRSRAEVPLHRGSSADLLVAAVGDRGAEPVGKALVTHPTPRSGLAPLTASTTRAGTVVSWRPLKNVEDFHITGPEPSRDTVPANDPSPSVSFAAPLGDEAEIEIVADASAKPAPGHRYGVRVTRPGVDVTSVPAEKARALGPGDRVPSGSHAAGADRLAKTGTAYETFIPAAFLDVPETPAFPCDSEPAGTDYWFSGDGRDVGNGTGKFRTRGAVHHDWASPEQDVAVRDVHASHRYIKQPDGGLAHESQRTASDEGFAIDRRGNDGTRARDVIHHSVGNPYCAPLLDLDYTVRQDLYRNGGHWIRGSHDRMPDHQLYRTDVREDGSVAEELVLHHRTESPACLEPGACSPWRYQYVK